MPLNLEGNGAITGATSLASPTQIQSGANNLVLQADPTAAHANTIIGLEIDGGRVFTVVRAAEIGRLITGRTGSVAVGNSNSAFQFHGVGGQRGYTSGTTYRADNLGPIIALAKSRGTAVDDYTAVNADDQLGDLRWTGADGTDLAGISASIIARAATAFTTTSKPGVLTFNTTATNSVSTTERVRIDQSGRLLIGRTEGVAVSNQNLRFQLLGTTQATARAAITRESSDAGGAGLHICKARGNSFEAPDEDDQVGIIAFNAATGSNYASQAASIQCLMDADGNATRSQGRLQFATTTDASTTPQECMRITSGGAIRFGNPDTIDTSPSQGTGGSQFSPSTNRRMILDLRTNSSSSNIVARFYNSNGQVGAIRTSGNATNFDENSDYRLKENVTPIIDGIERVKQLKPCRFNFIADPSTTVDGFLAHEAQEVVPEGVTGVKDEVEVWEEGEVLPFGVSVGEAKVDENGNTIPVRQGIDKSKFVPLLTAGLKEAIGRIETLEAEVAQLALIVNQTPEPDTVLELEATLETNTQEIEGGDE